MKLVLDSNVLIAALIAQGVCTDLLEHCIISHTVLTSDFILDEVRRHLTGKFKHSEADADEAVQLLREQMTVLVPAILDEPACRDPDDDQILGTALAGTAAYIVTGDRDLLVLQRYRDIPIVTPREFMDLEPESESA